MVAVTVSACRMATDFKCANNVCLPKSVKCDGYNHCGDGSDEAEICGTFFVFFLHRAHRFSPVLSTKSSTRSHRHILPLL